MSADTEFALNRVADQLERIADVLVRARELIEEELGADDRDVEETEA